MVVAERVVDLEVQSSVGVCVFAAVGRGTLEAGVAAVGGAATLKEGDRGLEVCKGFTDMDLEGFEKIHRD